MRMPGFTAERSLERDESSYAMWFDQTRIADRSKVVPQVFVPFIVCYETATQSVCEIHWIERVG